MTYAWLIAKTRYTHYMPLFMEREKKACDWESEKNRIKQYINNN